MRGEHADFVDTHATNDGSSPHAGEHRLLIGVFFLVSGSSPHARGTHRFNTAWKPIGRFIPACAGNTRSPARSPANTPVHPRMRGEHWTSGCSVSVLAGSSPHARGTRGVCPSLLLFHRFIPACAGNTIVGPADAWVSSVHPRMRGEHFSAVPNETGTFGSSPHARGTPRAQILTKRCTRFIPACAGNTKAVSPDAFVFTVHPRMRGEHSPEFASAVIDRGSSPHARGTRADKTAIWFAQRFIPACAGNTVGQVPGWFEVAVHPRMRGEHVDPWHEDGV